MADLLPPSLARSRLVAIPALIAMMRDSLVRHGTGMADGGGNSVNGLSASLNLPFETVRRNIQRLAREGWVARTGNGGVTIEWSASAIHEWCAGLPARMQRIADDLDATAIAPNAPVGELPCGPATTLATLELLLATAEAANMFDTDFRSALFIHYICGASVRELSNDLRLAVALADTNAPPPDAVRAFVPLVEMSDQLGISRSTGYRLAIQAVAAGIIERQGKCVRATRDFLASDLYVKALDRHAGRTAMLLSRLARHECGTGCVTPAMHPAFIGGIPAIPRLIADY